MIYFGSFMAGLLCDILTHLSIVYRLTGDRFKAAISVFSFTVINMLILVYIVQTNSIGSVICFAFGRFFSAAFSNGSTKK